VLYNDGPLLVLAGVGTGKTEFLNEGKCPTLISNGTEADRILAVTFTNKASKEMMKRVNGLKERKFSQSIVGWYLS